MSYMPLGPFGDDKFSLEELQNTSALIEDKLRRFTWKYENDPGFVETINRLFRDLQADAENKYAKISRFSSRVLLVRLRDAASNHSNRIVRPPGAFLSSIAEFLYSPKTRQHVIMPIISDLQMEYCEALAAGRPYKAAWVRVRGYWSFFKAIGLYTIMKTLVEMWRKVSSV